MICKRCADAADYRLSRKAHCQDEKCPCQHRAPEGAPDTVRIGTPRVVADVLVGGVA